MKRKIIKIDEEKCDGCGQCVSACAEGALQIIDGKARLVKEEYCDGLGDCLGECPQGAITMEEREAEPFSEEAVSRHLNEMEEEKEESTQCSGTCPGGAVRSIDGEGGFRLQQWPVQMELVPVTAPFLQEARLLLAADCVPVASPDFHRQFLDQKAPIIGCPKLDDAQGYLKKLVQILKLNEIKSLEVLYMEVPCCRGLVKIAEEAVKRVGSELKVERICIGLNGQVKEKG